MGSASEIHALVYNFIESSMIESKKYCSCKTNGVNFQLIIQQTNICYFIHH